MFTSSFVSHRAPLNRSSVGFPGSVPVLTLSRRSPVVRAGFWLRDPWRPSPASDLGRPSYRRLTASVLVLAHFLGPKSPSVALSGVRRPYRLFAPAGGPLSERTSPSSCSTLGALPVPPAIPGAVHCQDAEVSPHGRRGLSRAAGPLATTGQRRPRGALWRPLRERGPWPHHADAPAATQTPASRAPRSAIDPIRTRDRRPGKTRGVPRPSAGQWRSARERETRGRAPVTAGGRAVWTLLAIPRRGVHRNDIWILLSAGKLIPV